eukprot:m.236469 g.236469  ORF g.236469 m.236469 type:complete len:64 (+) comp40133_c0_seq4:137-328(+)
MGGWGVITTLARVALLPPTVTGRREGQLGDVRASLVRKSKEKVEQMATIKKWLQNVPNGGVRE